MNVKKFLLDMFQDAESGGISSKRVIGFLAFVVYVSLIFINTYTDRRTPDIFVDGLMYMILGAFLGGTLEYFSKRQPITTVKTGDDTKVTIENPITPAPTDVTPPVQPQPQIVVNQPTDITPANGKEVNVVIVDKNIPE